MSRICIESGASRFQRLNSSEERRTPAAQSNVLHLLFLLTGVLLTRFSWTPTFFGTDRVNLAYALDVFDPARHQPHPPGYPLFVAFARMIHFLTSNVEVTFWTISVIATVLSGWLLYTIAARMVSSWAAAASLILFLLNPILWFSRLRSPLRPWLAVFSLLVGYCAWRTWTGERRFILWGALALGIGAGFRPDLIAYLLPIWAFSAWKSQAPIRLLLSGVAVLAALGFVWFAIVADAMGGVAAMLHIIWAYITFQSRTESIAFADSIRSWTRPISRLLLWNSMAVLGWVWAPILLRRRMQAMRVPWMFLFVWLAPGILFQLIVHIGEPGHTLFAIPVFCLIGGAVLSLMPRYRNAVLTLAAIVSAGLFLNAVPFGYPPSPDSPLWKKAWLSLKNSIAYGTFETSMQRLEWTDELRRVSIEELWRFRLSDRPTIIVALNGNGQEFDFISWRVVSYYMGDQRLRVLMDNTTTNDVGRVRFVQGMNMDVAPAASVTLPRSGRILWIMQPGGRFHQALQKVMSVQRGRYILYSDIPEDIAPFEIEGFKFAAEEPVREIEVSNLPGRTTPPVTAGIAAAVSFK
jgi:hypothetical protein